MTHGAKVLVLAGAAALLTGCGTAEKPTSEKPKDGTAHKPSPPCQVTAQIPGTRTASAGEIRVTTPRPTVIGSVRPKDAAVTIERSEFDKSGNSTTGGFQSPRPVATRNGAFKYTVPALKAPTTGLRFTAKAPGCRPGTARMEVKHPPLTEAQKVALRQKQEQQRIEREQRQQQRIQEYKASAQTIPYNQLEKNAEKFAGTKVKYTGQIFQIQEGSGSTVVLLAVTDKGYGIWDDNVWVDISGAIKSAKDDMITVYGVVKGSKSYETQIGGQTYVPQIKAKYVEE